MGSPVDIVSTAKMFRLELFCLPLPNDTHAQAVFPGRLQVIVGDSAATVPAFAMAEETAGRDPRVCGVVFVDGDHSEEGAYADITNLQALASRCEA